jgi:2-polyprenyl-3-methyl-5-hydroxy-6-metoxy-1,4-benzoquinol methylase
MKIIRQIIGLIHSGMTTEGYYVSMNNALRQINNEYTMLHYPFHVNEADSFLQAQTNLTDYCLSHLESPQGKDILDIGCGNGVQTKYIQKKLNPRIITGIDLNHANIDIANSEKSRMGLKDIQFEVDDAQRMSKIGDQSYDVVLNIESAFHYPDKSSFIREIERTLKPGGHFIIADILTRRIKMKRRNFWKRNMVLNHWPLNNYQNGFKEANLEITQQNDITPHVIRGFQNYRRWLRERQRKGFFSDLAFGLFYAINAYLNIVLLKRRRQYMVFVGSKPFSQGGHTPLSAH